MKFIIVEINRQYVIVHDTYSSLEMGLSSDWQVLCAISLAPQKNWCLSCDHTHPQTCLVLWEWV